MEKVIFSGHGIDVIIRNGTYFIRYDAGEIVVQKKEEEITFEQAVKAQRSERDAYEVILRCQNSI